MKDILKKLKDNQDLMDEEKRILAITLEEHLDTLKYYSQNFAGTWDNDKVNVNWRALKCEQNIQNKLKPEIVCPVVVRAKEKGAIDGERGVSGSKLF